MADDYDDDFETYEDDFHENNNITATSPNISMKTTSHSLNSSNILDPKYRRLMKLKASNILQLYDEKCTILHILPCSSYDNYIRLLRSSNSNIRQIGIPIEKETRDIEISTELIEQKHKEMQFTYGDDTIFLNVLSAIQKKSNIRDVLEITNDINRNNTSKLSSFLQKATIVMETLLQENEDQWDKSHSHMKEMKHKNIFSDDFLWKVCGNNVNRSFFDHLRKRKVIAVKYSELQPHLLMTIHPALTLNNELNNQEKNLSSYALYCIWDSSLTLPIHVLASHGSPSCCTFSSSQWYHILVGTQQGGLFLWDLRESDAIHKDTMSMELGLSYGLRKPSFSTHYYSATRNLNDFDTIIDEMSHVSPVIQVESIGLSNSMKDTSSVVSHFASLDIHGNIVLWITSNIGDQTSFEDQGVSPWSCTRLIGIRKLVSTTNTSTNFFAIALSTIPLDTSAYLMSQGYKVHKLSRYGSDNTNITKSYYRQIDDSLDTKDKATEILHYGTVTCMSCNHLESYHMNLILVGRSDGGIDLFDMSTSHPIYSWNITDYKDAKTSKSSSKSIHQPRNASISMIKWLSNRKSAFLCVDSLGNIYIFQLLEDFCNPWSIDTLDVNLIAQSSNISSYMSLPSTSPIFSLSSRGPMYTSLIDLSSCRPGTRICHLAIVTDIQSLDKKLKREIVSDEDSTIVIKVRKLQEDLFKTIEDEEEKLFMKLQEYMGRIVDSNILISF